MPKKTFGTNDPTSLEAGAQATSNAAIDRRQFLTGLSGAAVVATAVPYLAYAAPPAVRTLNLARVATPTSRVTTSENKIGSLNDGLEPISSADHKQGSYVLRRALKEEGEIPSEWVQYEWVKPVSVNKMEVYWAIDPPRPDGPPGSGWGRLEAPESYRVLYWDGSAYKPVGNPRGYGIASDHFNTTTFDSVTTEKLRLEVIAVERHGAGIQEWRVFNAGDAPSLPPVVHAGVDRTLVLGGRTYLAGQAIWLEDLKPNTALWSRISGPGEVKFADPSSPVTTATFSSAGEYELRLTASGSGQQTSSTLHVSAQPAPPAKRLDVVYTTRYAIDSPLWNVRAKSLIVNWIPHCVAYCERKDIAANRGDGGIDNFIEAAKANRGEPHAPHKGYVFSNAWVHQTVESMCIALMVDPQGDAEIIAAQEKMRATLERWIPLILAAQMNDGYLQTAYILADRKAWSERWSADHRGNHEGYVSGYFIESAINHYTLTDGKDLRLYNGAKKLADCWVANIGVGKKDWYDGHQEMEQALVRFGRFVNDQEGNGRGDSYIALAKFLLDSRRGGSEYDQSHQPPGKQYEAVGHAVRATYFYSGMADIAAETGDHDYQSAVLSIWDNMVNRKYYLTGGIGSGETSEGFGPNYSLRNNAYCESCSSCGLVFFQYKLNLAYHEAKFADLYEQTIYNALLGSTDLDGTSFCYTNPLVNTERTRWHVCPCCVGNIPRTLLMMPTWTYVKGEGALYVNLFVGSRINVGKVAGTNVHMVQKTDYPWKGTVAITVEPEKPATFTLHVRVPNRKTSALYIESPAISGLNFLSVNGKRVTPKIVKGYAVLAREWKKGDIVEFELPLEPQRVIADDRIKADLGDVALKYGPMVYNVETADQANIQQPLSAAPLKAEWRPDLLQGVMVITGTWKDGSPMRAVPNYARMNRVDGVHEYLVDSDVNYAPGATTSSGGKLASKAPTVAAPATPVIVTPSAGAGNTTPTRNTQHGRERKVDSKVWV